MFHIVHVPYTSQTSLIHLAYMYYIVRLDLIYIYIYIYIYVYIFGTHWSYISHTFAIQFYTFHSIPCTFLIPLWWFSNTFRIHVLYSPIHVSHMSHIVPVRVSYSSHTFHIFIWNHWAVLWYLQIRKQASVPNSFCTWENLRSAHSPGRPARVPKKMMPTLDGQSMVSLVLL